MFSVKTKSFVCITALIFMITVLTTGCSSSSRSGMVNTSNLPGQTYKKYEKRNKPKKSTAKIVYLGDETPTTNADFGKRSFDEPQYDFGPADKNGDFQFKNLKQ